MNSGKFVMTSAVILAAAAVWAQDAVQTERAKPDDAPKLGVATLTPTADQKVRGVIVFVAEGEGVRIRGRVRGLTPGKHGFHIHEFGDLRSPDGTSAGGHYNPDNKKHGAPGSDEHHVGDLGNIEADENGVAQVNIQAPWIKLHYVIGRALVVHGGEDDLKSQPSGDAGARVAVGIIGIGNPEARPARGQRTRNN